MLRGQLLQHVRRCGVACLCLLSALQSHFLKKDHSKLFRRVDIEHLTRLFIDLFFQLFNLDSQPVAVLFQLGRLHFHPVLLHVKQGKDKGHLYLLKKAQHPCLLQLLQQKRPCLPGCVGLVAGFYLILRLILHQKGKLLPGHILKCIVTFQRVQKVCCYDPVKAVLPVAGSKKGHSLLQPEHGKAASPGGCLSQLFQNLLRRQVFFCTDAENLLLPEAKSHASGLCLGGKKGQYVFRIFKDGCAHLTGPGSSVKDLLRRFSSPYDPEVILHCICRACHIKFSQQIFKLKPLEQCVGLLGKYIFYLRLADVILYVRIHTDGCQSLAHDCHVPMLFQCFGSPGRLQLIRVLVGVFDGMIRSYDL